MMARDGSGGEVADELFALIGAEGDVGLVLGVLDIRIAKEPSDDTASKGMP